MKTTVLDPTQIASWFRALSDETRVRVVEILASGEKCVCELQDELHAAQSRLSFHLKVLREAGLVNDRRQGRWVYYSLRPEALEAMADYLQEKSADASVWRASSCCVDVRSDSCCE